MIIKDANNTHSQEISKMIKASVLSSQQEFYPKDKIENVIERYQPKKIEEYLKEGKYLIATEKNKLVGCVLVIKNEMRSLYIHPDYMRKGIGTQLSQKAEEYIKDQKYPHVWIWASLNAVHFYKSRGFKEESSITDKKGNTWYIGMKKEF